MVRMVRVGAGLLAGWSKTFRDMMHLSQWRASGPALI